MRKNQQKNTTYITIYKRQSQEKTEKHKREQNEIKEMEGKNVF